MKAEIKKARDRFNYHTRVLADRVEGVKLTLVQRQENVNKAKACLDDLLAEQTKARLLAQQPAVAQLWAEQLAAFAKAEQETADANAKLTALLNNPDIVTREDWLNAFVHGARPIFKAAGYILPEKIKISIGFPSKNALSTRTQRLGEHWNGTEEHQIFITPLIATAAHIGSITTHELCHTLFDGHRKDFAKCGAAVGLEGKPKEMTAGALWHELFDELLTTLGAMPHHALSAKSKEEKKQSTRLLKCQCPECGFVFRTTAKWIEGKSELQCPDIACGGIIKLEEGEEEE